MKTEKRIIGDIGEKVVVNFLLKKGYKIIEKNYLKKFGEIDIVAVLKKDLKNKKQTFLKKIIRKIGKEEKEYYFFEVKTIEINKNKSNELSFLPEDNFTKAKIRKFNRIVEYYVKDKKILEDYYLGVVYVYLDNVNKTAKIKFIQKIEI